MNRVLAGRAAGWGLVLVVVALYGLAYRHHDLFPGYGSTTEGWWTWNDQSRYLTEAAAIAEGRLDRTNYTYPIGYPALGAVFWRWMPAHAFLLPNLLLIAGSAAAWWSIARRWFSPVASLGVGMLFVVFHRWLVADTQVIPWNTLPTQCALLAGIAWLVGAERHRRIWPLALLAGATYVVRPVDLIAFGPLLVCGVWQQPDWARRVREGAVAAGTLGAFVFGVAMLNLQVLGSWRTPYDLASVTVGFCSYPFAYKCFWLLVDGRPLFGETDPAVLFRYPWLLLVLPATVFWVLRDGGRAVAALGAVAASWIVYLNYNDFLPSDVYRFTLIHYLAWSFPLLFLVVAAAIRHGARLPAVRVGLVGTMGLSVVGAGLRLDERPLAQVSRTPEGWPLPAARPLLIRYQGAPSAAVSRLRIDGSAPREYAEYLTPFVESDLRLLLSARRRGEWLTEAPGAEPLPAPAFAEYVWRWRWNPGRVRRLCQ